MANKPLVAIVIVNWNKKEMTRECLKSLNLTAYPNFKTLLVDNGSTDGSIEYLKKLNINSNIEFISLDKNYGYTIGTNIGWRHALREYNADYICVMDNDVITIQEEWLDRIIDELEKSPEHGIGSGKHLFEDGKLQSPYIGTDPEDHYVPDTGKYDFVREVEGFCGPAMVIKKSTIEKIGYYDENYFYGPNDIDYCNRARKAGIKLIYTGLSKSIHIGSVSGKIKNDKLYGKQAEGMMIFSFRYEEFVKSFAMVFRQLARSFFTRINPNEPMRFTNLYFYKSFPIRIGYWGAAVFWAIKKYPQILNEKYDYKVIE